MGDCIWTNHFFQEEVGCGGAADVVAYFMGGATGPSTQTASIEAYLFSSTTIAAVAGTLPTSYLWTGSFCSSLRGYCCGNPANQTLIEGIQFDTEATFTAGGTWSGNRWRLVSNYWGAFANSLVDGYALGSKELAYATSGEKMSYATETCSSLSVTFASWEHPAGANSDPGGGMAYYRYFDGYGQPATHFMGYSFALDTELVLAGVPDQSYHLNNGGAYLNSPTAGYSMDGNFYDAFGSTVYNKIYVDKILFATETYSFDLLIMDLPNFGPTPVKNAQYYACGANSTTVGITGGSGSGLTTDQDSAIRGINFSTDTEEVIAAVLVQKRGTSAGVQSGGIA